MYNPKRRPRDINDTAPVTPESTRAVGAVGAAVSTPADPGLVADSHRRAPSTTNKSVQPQQSSKLDRSIFTLRPAADYPFRHRRPLARENLNLTLPSADARSEEKERLGSLVRTSGRSTSRQEQPAAQKRSHTPYRVEAEDLASHENHTLPIVGQNHKIKTDSTRHHTHGSPIDQYNNWPLTDTHDFGVRGSLLVSGGVHPADNMPLLNAIHENDHLVCESHMIKLCRYQPFSLLGTDVVYQTCPFHDEENMALLDIHPVRFWTTPRGLLYAYSEANKNDVHADGTPMFTDADIYLSLMKRGGYKPYRLRRAPVFYPEDLAPFIGPDDPDCDVEYWTEMRSMGDIWRTYPYGREV